MSEPLDTTEQETPVTMDELTIMKQRATQMGIQFSPNIGLDKLREKVNAALKGPSTEETPTVDTEVAPVEETRPQMRARLRKEGLALRRIRVTCMNPVKKEWPGELFCFSNSMIGTVQKFVPFSGAEDGYHVPEVIYQMMKARKCQVFVTTRNDRGLKSRQGKLIPEFAIELLDPLTQEELDDLAARQALSGTIN